MAFNPSKHFPYASDAIEHIEDRNCSKGCIFAVGANAEAPGGSCDVLVRIILEEPVPELEVNNEQVQCKKRRWNENCVKLYE